MRSVWPVILIFAVALTASAASAQLRTAGAAAASEVPRAKAGGTDLVLPSPEGDFIEVGDRLRTGIFELLAPSTNRLLTAYVSSQTQRDLLSGTASAGLGLYAMVEVPRRAEYADLKIEDFQKVARTMADSMGLITAKVSGNTIDEINARLKELGANPVSVEHPQTLGVILRKTDAFGWAMLMAVKDGSKGSSTTMAMAAALLRVKQRMLFAYLYRPYESPQTIDSLSKLLDGWTDRIFFVE